MQRNIYLYIPPDDVINEILFRPNMFSSNILSIYRITGRLFERFGPVIYNEFLTIEFR